MSERYGELSRGRRRGDLIFIHFLDHELLRMLRIEELLPRQRLAAEFDYLMRISVAMAAEAVVIPAASYFESEWVEPIVRRLEPLLDAGRLFLSGNEGSIVDYHAQKGPQYRRQPQRHRDYLRPLSPWELQWLGPAWMRKRSSTTEELGELWRARVERLDPRIRKILERHRHPGLEDALVKLPEFLGGDAFIGPFAIEILNLMLPGARLGEADERNIDEILAIDYVFAYTRHHEGTVLVDLPLNASYLLPQQSWWISYRRTIRLLQALRVDADLVALSPERLLALTQRPEYQALRSDLVARATRLGDLWNADETAGIRFKRLGKGGLSSRLRTPTARILATAERYVGDLQRMADRKRQESMGPLPPQIHGDVHGDVTYGTKYQFGDTNIDVRHSPPEALLGAIVELVVGDLPTAAVAQQLQALDGKVRARGDIDQERIAAEVQRALDGPREVSTTQRLRALMNDLAVNTAGSLVGAGVLQGLQLLDL